MRYVFDNMLVNMIFAFYVFIVLMTVLLILKLRKLTFSKTWGYDKLFATISLILPTTMSLMSDVPWIFLINALYYVTFARIARVAIINLDNSDFVALMLLFKEVIIFGLISSLSLRLYLFVYYKSRRESSMKSMRYRSILIKTFVTSAIAASFFSIHYPSFILYDDYENGSLAHCLLNLHRASNLLENSRLINHIDNEYNGEPYDVLCTGFKFYDKEPTAEECKRDFLKKMYSEDSDYGGRCDENSLQIARLQRIHLG